MHECFERVFCELKWRKEVTTISCLHAVWVHKKTFNQPLCFQVEEEAIDKDNKNCSKDGMCGKVRLPVWVQVNLFCLCVCRIVTPDCCFCCRIFSSCFATEEMEGRKMEDPRLFGTETFTNLAGPDLTLDSTAFSCDLHGHYLHSIITRSYSQHTDLLKH